MIKSDPYFNTEEIAYRIVRDYYKHNNLIVAFDFDETINDFKRFGDIYPKMWKILEWMSAFGDNTFTLILYSAREGDALEEAKTICEDNGVYPDYCNESPVMDTRKPFANIYFDDKAGLGQAYAATALAIKILGFSDMFYDELIK